MTPAFARGRMALAPLAISLMAASASAEEQPMPMPLTCLLSPLHISDVGSERTGIVTEVRVDRADLVQKGQVLVQLDQALVEADLTLARISIEALSDRLEKLDRLGQRNLVSGEELEKTRTDLRLAVAEEKRARLALERTVVLAPFTGYVASVGVAVGELIGTEPLLRLIDIDTLSAEMVFTDAYYGEIAVGDEVDFAIDLTGAEVRGRVVAIDPFLDMASNTFSVLAEIDNSDRALPAGISCRVAGWDKSAG
ncbi:RND family efflux transporter, MFP subunit [Pseudooceanicola antarcticus]|uniref:Efflux RND transporter periplasmic adaptor subunit n=1 Tax=Pseudooceanicola antarcticus TaxID=1247613 RepID=A0A285J6J3_9RHOB|nr:efflux RND transporter periplasmic adaptor subunit [Pseudooceanicola antarcticus]PJE29643.1 efflux RND transporter periplasmic adaptor subunit [Pseudooceanicola antarcticus]SNY54976.1 RND family efflux transporter, MFP subunit [Pseudooceanicola antarcticus]